VIRSAGRKIGAIISTTAQVGEQPYGRIAADVRCSESVIRQRVSRGLATLRTIIQERP
jgi:hypothetical protein